jgi:hypothetical protein
MPRTYKKYKKNVINSKKRTIKKYNKSPNKSSNKKCKKISILFDASKIHPASLTF